MEYRTIAAPAESVFTEQRSKFLSFALPIYSAAEAKQIAKEYSKKFFDARHVCWAYMVGADRTDFLSTDNGEPSGTAGKPILGQINSFELTNIIIIVVRYFGGIKLGSSGLISAYRQAARQAIEAAEIIKRHEMTSIKIIFPYITMNEIMKIIKSNNLKIISQDFNNVCSIELQFPLTNLPEISALIGNIEGAQIID